MIGTGLLLWSHTRKIRMAKHAAAPHFGVDLVDTLNLGTIIGLPIAIAAYFWANRLLPVTLETRAAWEVHVMYLTFAAMLFYPVWRELDKAWIEMLWLAAASYLLLPVVNALTTQRHLGVSIGAGDWIMAGFDLTALATGVIFALFARRLQRKRTTKVTAVIAQAPVPEVVPESG
jgi:H+/gluconate symporter-like permease